MRNDVSSKELLVVATIYLTTNVIGSIGNTLYSVISKKGMLSMG